MNKASYAPFYCGMYPELAELSRSYGFAMSVHGSMQRDFDLVCIPWVAGCSKNDFLSAVTSEFSLELIGEPEVKYGGRECYTLKISYGECFIDLSFTPEVNNEKTQVQDS